MYRTDPQLKYWTFIQSSNSALEIFCVSFVRFSNQTNLGSELKIHFTNESSFLSILFVCFNRCWRLTERQMIVRNHFNRFNAIVGNVNFHHSSDKLVFWWAEMSRNSFVVNIFYKWKIFGHLSAKHSVEVLLFRERVAHNIREEIRAIN